MNCMVHSVLAKLQEPSKHSKLGSNYFNFLQKRYFYFALLLQDGYSILLKMIYKKITHKII